MNSYKKTVLWLISPLSILFLTLTALSFWLEPFRGDLSRIAGLPDNYYGWESEQIRFKSPLFDNLSHPDLAQKSYEIVVLGDSFSYDLEHSWLNYVAAATGFSAVRYDIDEVTPDDIIKSATYEQSPPKLFIYQTVERHLHKRAPRLKESCVADSNLTARKTSYRLQPQKASIERRPIPQPRPFSLDVPVQFIKKSIERQYKRQSVEQVDLTTKALFSSRKSNRLLYHRSDMNKFTASKRQHLDSRCGLKDLQHKIQQKDTTNFLVLVAPDKSSIYADYIKAKGSYKSDVSELISLPLNAIDMHQLLRQEVAEGVVDVYLPDDTHWGTAGYQLAAKKVVDFLKNES